LPSKLVKRDDNKGQSDDPASLITYLRCLQVIGKGWKGAVPEQRQQGGKQSHAAGDNKCKWKAIAYHS